MVTSALGHSLPSYSGPGGRFVRCCSVVSTGHCNTLSLREKMECDDGSEISSWFYRSREDGVMGSLATG